MKFPHQVSLLKTSLNLLNVILAIDVIWIGVIVSVLLVVLFILSALTIAVIWNRYIHICITIYKATVCMEKKTNFC